MAKSAKEQENADLIVGLLEELRRAQVYGWDNEQDILASLERLGYVAEKPSKRAESRPATGRVEKR